MRVSEEERSVRDGMSIKYKLKTRSNNHTSGAV